MNNVKCSAKSTDYELNWQKELIEKNKLLTKVLDGINIYVIIMNRKREILFMNTAFCLVIGVPAEAVLGKRPGNLLKCKYYKCSEFECSNSRGCDRCTVKNLMVEAIQNNTDTEGDASLISLIQGIETTFTFRQKVTPITVENETLYMVAFADKSSEIEKNNLQSLFYHDILNAASSLYNIIRLMRIDNDKFIEDEEMRLVEIYIKNIIDEIEYQRNVTKAEQNNLAPIFNLFDLNELVEEVITQMEKDERFHQIPIEFTTNEKENMIKTDRTLLRRIVVNLVKNALEANVLEHKIDIRIDKEKEHYKLIVHNHEYISPEKQRDIFKKGFSSKGKGRGMGVYGSKLLLNKYLFGNLSFTSGVKTGTTFVIQIPKELSE